LSSKSANSIYFPSLNALRFMAALLVVITHIELIKHHLKYGRHFWSFYQGSGWEAPIASVINKKLHWISPLVSTAGPIGVVFFFVLSGFLISYLLLAERDKTGTIGLKAFYMRRILRIWPLYFIILILGFFILPNFDLFYIPLQSESLSTHFWPNLLLYIFILPNLALALYLPVPNIGQAWSIGVEEQFYIIWPLLFKLRKNILSTIIYAFLFFVLIKILFLFVDFGLLSSSSEDVIKKFLAATKVECMALGALAAYILFYKKTTILKIIYLDSVFYSSLASIPILIYCTPALLQDAQHLVLSISFLIIILNLSTNKKHSQFLENKFFSFLGKISYGIYMYHFVICTVVIKCFIMLNIEYNTLSQALIYFFIISLTVLISWLSYEYLEKGFLRLKSNYQKIKSTS
jgi:peptidoglycan/LPS O-acetylase OafA/YrhL